MNKRRRQSDSVLNAIDALILDYQLVGVSDSVGYEPVREASLRQNMLDSIIKRPAKVDMDISRYEDYLFQKWGGTDPMPDSFDPDKLEKVRRSRQQLKGGHDTAGGVRESKPRPAARPHQDDKPAMEQTESQNTPPQVRPDPIAPPTTTHTCEDNTPNEPTDDDAQLEGSESEGYDSEACIDDEAPTEPTVPACPRPIDAAGRRARARSEVQKRPSLPRIRAGSRPPLSRSAYVDGGVPCLDEMCRGACRKGVRVKKGRVRAPDYFPYQSQRLQTSRSKSKDGKQRVSTAAAAAANAGGADTGKHQI